MRSSAFFTAARTGVFPEEGRRIVTDDDDDRLAASSDIEQRLGHLARGVGVETRRRFVRHEQAHPGIALVPREERADPGQAPSVAPPGPGPGG